MLDVRWRGKAALALAVSLVTFSNGWGQLRVVQYNAGVVKLGFSTIIEQIGHESVNGIAKPADVLVVEEQSPSYIPTLLSTLNGIYGAGAYAAAPMVGQTSGGGLPLMVYRTSTVSLIGEPTPIGTVSTSGSARQTIKYDIRPVGYDSSADVFVYASHLRSSSGSTNAAKRDVEVTSNRADADAMGAGKNILYIGDFNFYSGNEPGYTTLTAPGNGQGIDPTGAPLVWTGAANRIYHTQSPATEFAYEGQVTGGMNDRFDFQFSSTAMNDGHGVALIPGSYRAFGNNGTHPLNGAINDPANTWDNPGLTVPRTTVLNALTTASDHVPVVADYQLPAKMSVAVTAPSRVIVGSSAAANVTVTNSAPVAVATGADSLDYTLSGSGAWSGSFNGNAIATHAGNQHAITLDTSSPGLKSGTIEATSSSQSVANGSFSQAVATMVVAHATPSFAGDSAKSALSIDYGIRARGIAISPTALALSNIADAGGFTAALDLDAITPLGRFDTLTTTLAPFANLPAGSQHGFTSSLDTGTIGDFSAAYALVTSDENILGATTHETMVLQLHATIALGGDANLDGMVNISDLAALANDWRSAGTWQQGDFNRDGFVDAYDLQILSQNWQQSGDSPFASAIASFGLSNAIPEPGSGLVVAIGSLMLIPRKRRAPNEKTHG